MFRYVSLSFAEFTVMLINNVFDALISANIRQTESYMQLVESVGQSLQQFVANTHPVVSEDQVNLFLAPLANISSGETLTYEDVTRVNEALFLPDEAGVANNNQVATSGDLDGSEVQAIRLAAAKRLAANKFSVLQEMMRQGILRIVVDNGIIESRLTFSTYSRSDHRTSTFDQVRKASQEGTVGGAVAGGVGAVLPANIFAGGLGVAAGVGNESESFLHVTTSRESQRDVSGSRVQIFGRVELHFETDYVPLNT